MSNVGILDQIRNLFSTRENPPPTSTSDYPLGEVVTVSKLHLFFPRASDDVLKRMADEMNRQIVVGKINTSERMAHFLGQVMQEVGTSVRLVENLNYSVAALKATFSYFANNPAEAERFGRATGQPADQEAIANRAYAGRIGNGDVASGDGWRFRGRGLKQTTGRDNYRQFTQTHERIFGAPIDFEASPALLADPRYAVRSALSFWLDNGLPRIADQGVTRAATDAITAVINRNTDSYDARWSNVQAVHESGFFDDLGSA